MNPAAKPAEKYADKNAIVSRRGLWARWFALLDHREAGTSLAMLRIGCGLTILASVLNALFRGTVPLVWLDRADGGYRTIDAADGLFQWLGGVNPTTLWSMIGVELIGAFCLVIGFGGRITAFVVLQTYLAISRINYDPHGCDDQLIGNVLWLLVLGSSTATLSLDCRLRSGNWTSERLVSAWPRYLVEYQLVIVYFTTVIHKVSYHWMPGSGYSALYYMLQEPSWQRYDMSWLAWVYPLTQVATALTWCWELSSPLLLLAAYFRLTKDRPGWLRQWMNWLDFRKWFVLIGIGMHLGIWMVIGLGPFSWITIAMYSCLFSPVEWQQAFARIRREGKISLPTIVPPTNLSRELDVAAARWPSPGVMRFRKFAVRTFVTLHMVIVTLASLPAPFASITRQDWDQPPIREEMAAWSEIFQSLGIFGSEQEFKDSLWGFSQGYIQVRDSALRPLAPYFKYCGTQQGWPMFVGPNMQPTRLHVDIREHGQWRPLFIERDTQHDWRSWQFSHEHLRVTISTLAFFKIGHRYDELSEWIASQVARDFPTAEAARIRIWQFQTRTPAQVRAGMPEEGSFINPRVIEFGNGRN